MSDQLPVELLLQARDEMSAALNKAIKGMGGFEKAADTTRGAVKDAGEETEKATKKFNLFGAGAVAVGNLLSGVVAGAFGAIKSQVGNVASAMIDGNREFETYTTQFGVLLGSADKAKERLAALAEFGAKTPFELPEVVRADKILTGFGLTSDNVAEKFGFNASQIRTIAGDVASGAGVSFEEMAGYLGKFSSGATGEAISRFQELGIATREQLAGLGLEFSKSGELLSPLPQSMEVVLKLMKDKYGGMMDAQSATMDGMMSNLQDWVKGTLREVGQPIFELLKDKLVVVLAFLNDPKTKAAIQEFAGRMMAYFSQAVKWVEDHWPEIQQTISDVFAVIQWAWVNVLYPVLTVLVDVIRWVVKTIKDNWPEIDRQFKLTVEAIRIIWEDILKPTFTNLVAYITWMVDAFRTIPQRIHGAIDYIKNIGRAMLDGIINGIMEAPGRVFDALAAIVDNAIDRIKLRLGIASPSKVFEKIGGNMMAGLAKGISGAAGLPNVALAATVGGATGTAAMAASRSVVNNYNLTAQYATRTREDLAGDVRLLQMAYGRA